MKRINRFLSAFIKGAFALIVAFPFYYQFAGSFMTTKEMNTIPITLFPSSFSPVNYIEAWTSGPFGLYIFNSLAVTFGVMLFSMFIIVPSAYGFAKFQFKGRGFFFALVLMAFMIPSQVTFLSVYTMFSKLKMLGTLWPQILPFIGNAFGVFFLRQHFMQIPDELIEAARIDNASEVDIIYRVMVPLSGSSMATVLLFCFIGRWNDYFWPLIMSVSEHVRPLTVGVAMLKSIEGLVNYNVVMAGNMILIIPLLIIYVFASKKVMTALTYSGIK